MNRLNRKQMKKKSKEYDKSYDLKQLLLFLEKNKMIIGFVFFGGIK